MSVGKHIVPRAGLALMTAMAVAGPSVMVGSWQPRPAFAAAEADAERVWLSRRGVPGWPVRNDWNFARTTTFSPISTDGRWTLLSAGSQSGGNGSDWSALYLKNTVTGTTTLVSTDESGRPFAPTTGNLNGVISPGGGWVLWLHRPSASEQTVVYARDNTSGQVYRMPGPRAGNTSTITDDGIAYVAVDTTSLPGGSAFLRAARWDVKAGTVQPVDDPLRTATTTVDYEQISGDGRFLFLRAGNQHHVVDTHTGAATALPHTPRQGTQFGVVSVSRTGRYVLIWADDPNLSPASTTSSQLYLLDRDTAELDWVSAPSPGGRVDPTYSYSAVARAVSEDGRYIMFGGDTGRLDIPPLDSRHPNERSNYFAGAVFLRDRRLGTTELVLPTYSYGIAIDARAAVFDTPHSIDPADPDSVDVYLYRGRDSTPPVVTGVADREPDAANWYNADVTITWSSADPSPSSGAATVPPPTTASTEGADVTYTSAPSCDAAGNCATGRVDLSIDKTPPTATAVITGDRNAAGWFREPPRLRYECADALSGVGSCPADVVVDTDGPDQAVARTVADRAGNTRTVETTGLDVDLTGPALTIGAVTDGASYLLGAAPTPACTATDVTSGLAAPCTGMLTGGNHNGVGTFTYTATATDNAGNTTTRTVRFRVSYRFGGFAQPIDDPATTPGATASVFRAGSTVPAKFVLTDAAGNAVISAGDPVWLSPERGQPLSAPIDEAVYSDPADTGSVFRRADGHYQYNWGTTRSQAGYWWRIGVRLDDGTTRTVTVGLR